jgi:hypothetical protein
MFSRESDEAGSVDLVRQGDFLSMKGDFEHERSQIPRGEPDDDVVPYHVAKKMEEAGDVSLEQ